jgi:hypothetical protein
MLPYTNSLSAACELLREMRPPIFTILARRLETFHPNKGPRQSSLRSSSLLSRVNQKAFMAKLPRRASVRKKDTPQPCGRKPVNDNAATSNKRDAFDLCYHCA